MKSFDTIIFDMDGTLLNTLEDLTDSANYVLKKYHLPTKEINEIKYFVGNGIPKLVQRFVPDGKENPDFSKILVDFKAHYSKNCNHKTDPYEGVLELLTKLKEKKIKMAIVSNKQHESLLELVKVYFGKYITVAIGERENVKKKPAKDMVVQALRVLGSEKENAVYVGDSEIDIATARNSEMDCICVSWGFRNREELIGEGAKIIVDTPMDILDCIEFR